MLRARKKRTQRCYQDSEPRRLLLSKIGNINAKVCEDGNEFHVGHTEFDLMKRNIDPYGDIRQAVGK